MNFLFLLLLPLCLEAKEIALSFDDAPMGSSYHFSASERTDELTKKLDGLPPAMVFVNACKGIKEIKKYREHGHLIANHSCSHPRLDEVGYEKYVQDIKKGDDLLSPFFVGQKFFRFPYLNEGTDIGHRDKVRAWLKKHDYRNGMVSVDNDDYVVSFRINEAKKNGKKIDYAKIKKILLDHLLGAVDFYDDLAIKTIGRSPKHVLLLHEMDATIMVLDEFVKELRKKGWTIISAEEAYQDKLYQAEPKNNYANNGILAQIAFDKMGDKVGYFQLKELEAQLQQAFK